MNIQTRHSIIHLFQIEPLCSKKAQGILAVFLRDELREIFATAKMITWSTLYDINCSSRIGDLLLSGPFLSDVPCLMHETTKQKAQILRSRTSREHVRTGNSPGKWSLAVPGSAITMHAAAGRQCAWLGPCTCLEPHVPRVVVPHGLHYRMQSSSSSPC